MTRFVEVGGVRIPLRGRIIRLNFTMACISALSALHNRFPNESLDQPNGFLETAFVDL